MIPYLPKNVASCISAVCVSRNLMARTHVPRSDRMFRIALLQAIAVSD